MSRSREPVRELPHGPGVSAGDGREAGRRSALGRGGLALGGLGFTLCVGLASCAIAAAARPPPLLSPCEEPVEVVEQVDHGWALLVGQDESDVRFVPAARLVEGMALSRGVPSAACGAWLHGRVVAARRGARAPGE